MWKFGDWRPAGAKKIGRALGQDRQRGGRALPARRIPERLANTVEFWGESSCSREPDHETPIIGEARKIGYRIMKLDTISTMAEALGLYRSLGFVEAEPYTDNPVARAVFFELGLGERSPMPPIERLVETGIYADDLDNAETFYRNVLGLEMLTKEPRRHVFFRVGESVLLIFRAEETLKGGMLPPHGAQGPGHFALGVPTDSLDRWREHLRLHGVEIEKEVEWPKGGRSLYFRDPAGNSVELVTRGLWGLPSGW